MDNRYAINKRYTVAQVRERLSEALDQAEQGGTIIIERRGVRYRLTRESHTPRRPRRREPLIEILDPAVAEGQWTWDWTPKGLKFRASRKR
jgi:antitoxin (DNA-binding transcriptional repressor) of toxin-antitoxin stability system